VADREIEHGKDGSVEIAYRVADVDELVRWVLSWGAQAEVLAPAQAREGARRLLAEMASTYEQK